MSRRDSAPQALRVGMLSDTHGFTDPRIRETLSGCACIIHAGDVGTVGVLDELRRISPRVVAVRGNNDHELPLSEIARLSLPGGEIVIVHGDSFGDFPEHDELRRSWPTARAVVYGHTHRLVDDREDMPWVLNPGAAGRTRVGAGPSCLTLQAHPDAWQVDLHRFPA